MSEFFGRLETELRAAAERPPRRTVPVAAILVAGLLALALAPIVLVLGSGSEGAPEREAASDAPPPAPGQRTDHSGVRWEPPGATVIVTGTSSVTGPWQLQTYEQAGLGRCIGVALLHADPQEEVTFSGTCPHFGGPPLPAFIAGATGVPPTPNQKEYVVYGWTPEEAATVELVRDGEVVARVGTSEGPEGMDGDFYVFHLPPDLELDGVMRWIGEDGRTGDEVGLGLP